MISEDTKTGFLGGTFDPVHKGHLVAAQDVCEYMDLDGLYFIPTAQNPFKKRSPLASAEDRLAMVDLAIAGNTRFKRLDIEIETGGNSYTVDTVKALREKFSGHRLFWIIGSDEIEDLSRWRNIDELVCMVEFISVERPGHVQPQMPQIQGLRLHQLTGDSIEADSSEIRKLLGEGLSVDLLLPTEVSRYISDKNLYQ